jgi:hypothetical protein
MCVENLPPNHRSSVAASDALAHRRNALLPTLLQFGTAIVETAQAARNMTMCVTPFKEASSHAS